MSNQSKLIRPGMAWNYFFAGFYRIIQKKLYSPSPFSELGFDALFILKIVIDKL